MKQYSFRIMPTKYTPFCQLDMSRKRLDFKGRSSPESSLNFYTPIMKRLDRVFRNGNNTLTANFWFEYFNTSSSKCIYDLLKLLALYKEKGAEIVINWYYEEDDIDMKEAGEDYEDILGINFNYVPR
ncbi:MAG: DUF1987 domain-containing protein [Bacteroidota bacterium]